MSQLGQRRATRRRHSRRKPVGLSCARARSNSPQPGRRLWETAPFSHRLEDLGVNTSRILYHALTHGVLSKSSSHCSTLFAKWHWRAFAAQLHGARYVVCVACPCRSARETCPCHSMKCRYELFRSRRAAGRCCPLQWTSGGPRRHTQLHARCGARSTHTSGRDQQRQDACSPRGAARGQIGRVLRPATPARVGDPRPTEQRGCAVRAAHRAGGAHARGRLGAHLMHRRDGLAPPRSRGRCRRRDPDAEPSGARLGMVARCFRVAGAGPARVWLGRRAAVARGARRGVR